MATVEVAAPKDSERTTRAIDREGHVLLTGIRWKTYEALLEDLNGSYLRLNYDGRVLAIMAPANIHEYDKKKIGRMVNEARVRGQRNVNLDDDPPPDLAIEAENTISILDRLSIEAGLGFPEIWRDDGKPIGVLHLQADGTYAARDESLCFPFLPMAEINRFLEESEAVEETTWIRRFRAWVKETIAPRFGGAGDAGEGA